MTVNSLLALTRRLRVEKFEWDVLSKRLKSFLGSMEQVAQCSMPTLKSSLSWEQVAEKFEWEVLSKRLKSLSGEC